MRRYLQIIALFVLTIHGQCLCAKTNRLTAYLADSASNTGTAVVVCPGGSYSWHDMEYEGKQVAQWLQANGINAFVLKYRVANISAYVVGYRVIGLGNKYPDMLTDVEDALTYIHRHADSLQIDPKRIGVMGFSAGGHLTMMSFTHNRTAFKPAFLCPIYPVVTMSDKRYTHPRSRRGALGVWRQWNKAMQDSLSIEKHIPADCPPVFLVNCVDDPIVKYQNSELLDSALTANNIPHTYLQYRTGGHGFGASENKGTEESQQWKKECIQWILSLNH